MIRFKRLTKTFLIILLLGSFSLSGCSISGCGPKARQQPGPKEPLTIEWWGVYKDEDYFAKVIERFEEKYTNIAIEYTKKDPQTYEQELIDALAANQGPDIAMIKNDWFYEHKEKLAPIELGQEEAEEFKEAYLPVVTDIVIEENKLYGVPLDIEVLGLFYNEDLFDEIRLRHPPADWGKFNNYAKKLTKKRGSKITQAGAAIGTSNNIENAQDILLMLMLQNNTPIASSDRQSAVFHTTVETASGAPIYTGRRALRYYTDFTNPQKDHYCWNKSQRQAWLAFAEEKVAMIFDYYSRKDDLYNRNPNLDYQFAAIPQIKNAEPEDEKVIARFWFYAVTNNVENHDWTWRFIQDLARQKAYSSQTERAERSQKETQGRKIFIGQGLIAETVYKGKDPDEFDRIFQNMITNIVTHRQDIRTAVDTAASKVTDIYKQSQ